ncbi:MAG TPA: hypothetical protein ENJ83_04705, partial [Rhodospirillales bacterium]|nr:hypothetical protein [Rhodospirillales bacterium]
MTVTMTTTSRPSVRAIVLIAAALAVSLAAGCSSGSAAGPRLEVRAGAQDRENCPVVFPAPDLPGDAAWGLLPPGGGEPIAFQRLAGDPPRAVFILDEPLAAGETRTYRFAPLPARSGRPNVETSVRPETITVYRRGRPVLVYHQETVEPPAGADPVFRRSGFIHPLYTPSGKIVTDDFPPDHFHQHGVFFAWVDTVFEGREVDFWNQAKKLGDVEHTAVRHTVSGPVFAEFEVSLRHIDKTAPGGPKAALQETWTVRIYDTGGPFLVDFDSRQQTASSSPLLIRKFRYGGFAVRGAREWLGQPEADFLTSEGKTRADGNHTRPVWVEMHGLVDGSPAGIVVLSAPSNFRHPQPVRLHPSKPYF